MNKLALLCLCLCLPLAANASMYKWVDKDGVVVFSQTPPEHGSYETLEGQRNGYRGNEDADQKKPDAAQEFLKENDKQHKGDAAIKSQEDKAQQRRAEMCETSKKQLEGLTAYRRIREKDGSVRVLDDKERETNIQHAKDNIREFCN